MLIIAARSHEFNPRQGIQRAFEAYQSVRGVSGPYKQLLHAVI
ncbi:hypothetical protein ACFOLK_08485 [Marinococcus halophilus]|nr:hypothetical protein [Marinococcus halophilus]